MALTVRLKRCKSQHLHRIPNQHEHVNNLALEKSSCQIMHYTFAAN